MLSHSPYIGLDVGTKRIGVATSNAEATIALPLETVAVGRGQRPEGRIVEITRQAGSTTIVVGWPLTLDGEEGRAVRRVQKFLDTLLPAFDALDDPVNIVTWDERLTTTAAESFLIGANVSRQRRKDVVDQIAATHILQGYLDSLRRDDG